MPKKWVHDLFRDVRAASWVDPQRCYLTGWSMGGMGTWEVATCLKDVIAAVAPVAAHHQQDRTSLLAESLRDLPILAVHSQKDSTCSFLSEKRLWEELYRRGKKLHVCYAPGVDHFSMFERSYGDDAHIFKWLLAHELGDNEVDDVDSFVAPGAPSRPYLGPQFYTPAAPASPTVSNGGCQSCFASYRGSCENVIGALSIVCAPDERKEYHVAAVLDV